VVVPCDTVANEVVVPAANRRSQVVLGVRVAACRLILELLIEPKYLAHLEEKKRVELQKRLIENLNHYRSMIEEKKQFISKNKKVLIVEDSKPTVALLKDMLQDANFTILGSVDDGDRAFEFYKNLTKNNNKPDIVIMDIFLKSVNGIKATKMIKDFDPQANIVVLTSSVDRKIKDQATKIGVEDYLTKPVTKAQLIDTLEKILAKNKTRMI